MTQGILPFKYENDRHKSDMTGFGGLPVYMDMAETAGLPGALNRYLRAGSASQGWTDSQVVMSLILMNLAGRDCVEDVNRLESDEGLCRIMRRLQNYRMRRG